VTDKGYDSDANRVAALARGITPVIPRRENSKQRGRFFPKRLYKLRARVEQTIGKLKRFKRVAMRCEKTDISYSAIISFACGLMLVKSVHTTKRPLTCIPTLRRARTWSLPRHDCFARPWIKRSSAAPVAADARLLSDMLQRQSPRSVRER
jgi:hypothetical protein